MINVGAGILDEDGDAGLFVEPWISSMYWAVTTMSTIGYGDISPGTGPERLCGMFLMTAGLVHTRSSPCKRFCAVGVSYGRKQSTSFVCASISLSSSLSPVPLSFSRICVSFIELKEKQGAHFLRG